MADKTGMSRHLMNTINQTNTFEYTYGKRDPRFKAIYQDYDWCYQKFMVEGMNHDEMAIEAGYSKRVIEKWCVEKHRITQKMRQASITLDNTQHDLMIGSLLGDGHIDKRETQPLFIVSHAANQKDYLYWKYDILKNICNKSPSFIGSKEVMFNGNPNTYIAQDAYRISTRIQDCLLWYRGLSVSETLDELNEFSLAVWILDDGSRTSSNWSLAFASFTEDEKRKAISVIKDKFNIDCYTIESDDRYLRFSAIDSRAIDEIIKSNIPNELDIVQYKIINKFISETQYLVSANNGEVAV